MFPTLTIWFCAYHSIGKYWYELHLTSHDLPLRWDTVLQTGLFIPLFFALRFAPLKRKVRVDTKICSRKRREVISLSASAVICGAPGNGNALNAYVIKLSPSAASYANGSPVTPKCAWKKNTPFIYSVLLVWSHGNYKTVYWLYVHK